MRDYVYRSIKTPAPENNERNIALVIIDPQRDFHENKDEGKENAGSLAVPNSDADAKRMARFINTNANFISNIVVSLDWHNEGHIGFPAYWMDAKTGEQPKPFTTVKFENGQFNGYYNGKIYIEKLTTYDPKNLDWATGYCKKLQEIGKYHMVWPIHCIKDTDGAEIVPVILEALQNWERVTKRQIWYIKKGVNDRTELYSALGAEVEDPLDTSTQINMRVINFLKKHNFVLIGGQAKSHCVKETLVHLGKYWAQKIESGHEKTEPSKAEIIVLSDTTSLIKGFENPKIYKNYPEITVDDMTVEISGNYDQSLVLNGIQGFVDGIPENKWQFTCCHKSLDKTSYLAGDVILVSNNMEAGELILEGKSPQKEVDFDDNARQELKINFETRTGENKAYKDKQIDKLLKGSDEMKRQLINHASKNFSFDDVYSDHVPVSRVVEGIRMISFNASFVLLRLQANLKIEQCIPQLPPPPPPPILGKYLFESNGNSIGGPTHGSEGLLALMYDKHVQENPKQLPLFDKFLTEVVKEDAPIIMLQEWISSSNNMVKRGGGDNYTNRIFSDKLTNAGYELFQTHSGLEGSCIAYKQGSAENIFKDVEEKRLNEMEQGCFWAWCCIPGRTWSAIKVTPKNKKSFLCINVHCPNKGPDGKRFIPNKDPPKPKEVQGLFDSEMKNYFQTKFVKDDEKYNKFYYKPLDTNTEFVELLLGDGDYTPDTFGKELNMLRNCYIECGKRLVISGDTNDMPQMLLRIQDDDIIQPGRERSDAIVQTGRERSDATEIMKRQI